MNMPLQPNWYDIALRLALTMLAGAIIGCNRGARGHAGSLGTILFAQSLAQASGADPPVTSGARLCGMAVPAFSPIERWDRSCGGGLSSKTTNRHCAAAIARAQHVTEFPRLPEALVAISMVAGSAP